MCLVVAVVVPQLPQVQLPLWIFIVGAVTATVAEGISLPVNDNFSVPLLSGLCMELLLRM
jgi:dolichol kinase